MQFTAKYPGSCLNCVPGIKAGDQITWSRKSALRWHVPACPSQIKTEEPKMLEAPVITEATIVAARSEVKKGSPVDDALARLKDALTAAAVQPLDESRIKVIVTETLTELRKNEVKRIEVTKFDGSKVNFDLAHQDLPQLIKLAQSRGPNGHRLNLYLHGPAGTGKSSAAHQVSQALGLEFSYLSLNPMTPDSRAVGFIHAGGSYVETEFFKRYTQGGVFCFDEIDNASASFTTTLNSCIENGSGAFPHGIFKRHPDFLLVCTANTIGRGGDIHYPERRALDGAFLDRFLFVEWPIDEALTRAIVVGILGPEKAPELISWVNDKASNLKAKHPELVISPRALIQSAILRRDGFVDSFIYEAAIARGIK